VNICVFLSAAELDARYTDAARELGRLIAAGGHTLVWGASEVGLMKVLADAVDAAGGRMIGISVDFLASQARTLHAPDEMEIAANLAERKAAMLARSDAVVIMVGGTGTLDEATEVLELRKHSLYTGPVVLLNTDGFYDGLQAQFIRMDAEGFLPVPLAHLCSFVDQPAQVLATIELSAAASSAVSNSAAASISDSTSRNSDPTPSD
jgi:uncharacterized protein (TIGR00730 family)